MSSSLHNPGCDFDNDWLQRTHVNLTAVNNKANFFKTARQIEGDHKAAWLLKALTCIDLTTLGGDDTDGNVTRLCQKACEPLPVDLLEYLGFEYGENCPIHTAAVCVYPAKVESAFGALKRQGFQDKIAVASVATGFPSGQYSLSTRLAEIKFAVEQGATEIDIVIDRSLVITGKWDILYDELKQMKTACGKAHMKAILATGELGNLNNVYKASLVAMMAGSHFIKTSTGKETINATLPVGIVMARAINAYEAKLGYKVGLKPAGGIKTASDALAWLVMVKETLGDEWLSPKLFRFGASGLLQDIEDTLCTLVMEDEEDSWEFTME